MWIPCLLFLVVFELYLRTHCATFNINDSGETILACTRLTISHSPGYPLHMLWGKFVDIVFPFGQPMMRVTLASIWTASMSVVLFYGILRRALIEALTIPNQGDAAPTWLTEAPALAGAFLFAFSYQQWFQAGGAKGGIYTLNMFLMLAILTLLFRVSHRGISGRSLFLLCLLFGLGLANHWPNIIVMTPVFLWFLFSFQTQRSPRELRDAVSSPLAVMLFSSVFLLSSLVFLTGNEPKPTRGDPLFDLLMMAGKSFLVALVPVTLLLLSKTYGWKSIARFATALLLGLSPYMALSIRSSQHPVVSWWNPDNWVRLWETMVRKGYSNNGDARSMATVVRDIKRFWFAEHDQFGYGFTFLVFVLSVVGLVWLWRRRPALTIGFAGIAGILFASILVFNAPEEGYQWTLDNFFTPIHMTVAFFSAMGLVALAVYLRKGWPGRLASGVLVAQVLFLGLCPLGLNWARTDQSRYVSSYDYGMNMLKSVNRTGVVLCNGDIDILPLWYLQHVMGKRPEVASLTMQLVPLDWYRQPLFEQYPFLKVPVTEDIRPQTVVQAMIDQHSGERFFYFTNIAMAPWIAQQNASVPDGVLWRVTESPRPMTPFSVERINQLWSGYRLRCLDAPDRGYWDEYTDVMKDSYGIGLTFMGPFCVQNGMPQQGIWSLQNALKYRCIQAQGGIHDMLAQFYLTLHDPSSAFAEAQSFLRCNPGNPYGFVHMGEALLGLGNLDAARQSFDVALRILPGFPEAQQGMTAIDRLSRAMSIRASER